MELHIYALNTTSWKFPFLQRNAILKILYIEIVSHQIYPQIPFISDDILSQALNEPWKILSNIQHSMDVYQLTFTYEAEVIQKCDLHVQGLNHPCTATLCLFIMYVYQWTFTSNSIRSAIRNSKKQVYQVQTIKNQLVFFPLFITCPIPFNLAYYNCATSGWISLDTNIPWRF